MKFIFMLTHHDVTIPNTMDVLDEVREISGLTCIGCKDVGLKLEQYKELFSRFKRYGIQSFLEVVTYSEAEHFRGVDLALKIGADNLIGGMPTYTKKTAEYLKEKESKLGFYPYIGKVTGHPCIVGGSIQEIIDDGKASEKHGITGINLLLYRYNGNQQKLLEAIKELKVPLIVAGNVANFDQIDELKRNNIWGFTIGGAIFEKKFVDGGNTKEQIQAVLKRL